MVKPNPGAVQFDRCLAPVMNLKNPKPRCTTWLLDSEKWLHLIEVAALEMRDAANCDRELRSDDAPEP